jgi:hypothetical protein
MNNSQDITYKFQANVTDTFVGEDEIVEFSIPLAPYINNPLDVAKALLEVMLNHEGDNNQYRINSIREIKGVVSISVDPICPN